MGRSELERLSKDELSEWACRKVCERAEKRADWRGLQAGFSSEGPTPSSPFHRHFQTLRQVPLAQSAISQVCGSEVRLMEVSSTQVCSAQVCSQ